MQEKQQQSQNSCHEEACSEKHRGTRTPADAGHFVLMLFSIGVGIPLMILIGWLIWQAGQLINSLPHG